MISVSPMGPGAEDEPEWCDWHPPGHTWQDERLKYCITIDKIIPDLNVMVQILCILMISSVYKFWHEHETHIM